MNNLLNEILVGLHIGYPNFGVLSSNLSIQPKSPHSRKAETFMPGL